jgi:O-antigen/teichoic acid export membrane protein
MSLRADATRIGKLSTIYLLGSVISQVVGFLLLPVFTHYLPPAQMGIVSLAGRLTAPLAVLVQLGLWSSLRSHYFRLGESERPQVVRSVLVGQLLQTGVAAVALSILGIWLAETFLPNLPLSSADVYLLWLMVVWGSFFSPLIVLAVGLNQLHERAIAAVSINGLRLLLQAGLGVLAVVGLGWLGLGRLGTIFAATVVVGIFSVREIWKYGRGGFDLRLFGRILRTGVTFVPHGLSGIMAVSINAWLLNRLVSPAALGVYGIAVAFAQLIQVSLQSFGNAAFPTLARMMQDGGTVARRRQSRIYTLLIAGIGAVALAIAIFAPVAIKILTAPQYHAAAPLMSILVLAGLFQGLYWVASNRVFYLGGGLWLSTSTISGLIVGVGLALLLIPSLGVPGAAWALVGSFLVRFAVIAVVAERMYPLPWQMAIIARGLAGMGLLWALDHFLLSQVGLWISIPGKFALLAATIPLARICGAVSAAEFKQAQAALSEALRRRVRGRGRRA